MSRWSSFRQLVSEQFTTVTGSLRNPWASIRRTFWPGRPAYDRTKVNFDLARQLYRNDGETNLGSGFCRPIIDLEVEFMGLPRSATGDEIVDDYLNGCIHVFWASALDQMKRNAMRDSMTVVRITRKDFNDDPLVTEEESEACFLEIIDPERVAVFYDEQMKGVIDRAYITHRVERIVEERDTRTRTSKQGRGSSAIPETREHHIVEEITRETFRYWDETAGEWIDDWEQENAWGFVPLREVYNEFDSALSGGQSDLEGPYPFIQAFHDVMSQTLGAHRYHSVPKVKFKIHEVQTFLMNNFPDSFETDAQGNPIPGTFSGEVSWKGTEILFTQPEEDVDFLEATSVLGDSKTLLEFLLDCICIASETPEWAFMRVEGAASGRETAQTLPFVKKIERKRRDFEADIQFLCKMALAITRQSPVTVRLAWEEILASDLVTEMQALQMLVMSLEVMGQRQIISDETFRATVRPYLPAMKAPDEEAADAEENFVLQQPNPNQFQENGQGDQRRVPTTQGEQGRNE
jgi:hypothetical protein